jgi:hypothetical protein
MSDKPANTSTDNADTAPAKNERLEAYSIKARGDGASVWTRCGSAFINRDGSINVYLDVLPLDGKLHIRKAAIRGANDPKAN